MYYGADDKGAEKEDVTCTGCPGITHCPADNLECGMYHAKCTNQMCTKKKHEKNGKWHIHKVCTRYV